MPSDESPDNESREETEAGIEAMQVVIDLRAEVERLKNQDIVARALAGPLIEDLRAKNARLRDALERLDAWAKAYPISAFPEPDFKRAAKLLKAGGMTIDAISASNMRHVIKQTQKIVSDALAEKEPADAD